MHAFVVCLSALVRQCRQSKGRALLLLLPALVAGCSAANRPDDKAGFYSWVDAQGNLVTVNQPKAPQKPESSAGQDASGDNNNAARADDGTSVAKGDAKPSAGNQKKLATNPDELWQEPDEAYQTDEQVQARIAGEKRDRFITYTDEQGRLVSRPVDIEAAREAQAHQGKGYEDISPVQEKYGEGSMPVTADCCNSGLASAPELKAGTERRLQFYKAGITTVALGGPRPALTFRLGQGVENLELQSWITRKGYQHPQLLFLDASGVPLLLVDNVFSRRYPETFFSLRSLFGIVPVESGAVYVTLFLPYAEVGAKGRVHLTGGQVAGQEPGVPFSLTADTVLRAKP